jgi:hypothetical protein
MNKAFAILLFLLVGYFSADAQNKKPFIAFASDTQEPMWVEKLFLKPDSNFKGHADDI